MTAHVLFAGCSYTAGTGLANGKDDPDLWTNLLHKKYFADLEILNVARGGRSNAGIFQDTVKHLVSCTVKYAVVAWTSMPRYELELGFELYDTRQCFIPNAPSRNHGLNNISYDAGYLDGIRDRFTTLAHEVYEITNLVEYVNTIKQVARLTGTQVFFVNALCPWDENFFNRLENVLPSAYTQFTQKILQVETRDDNEVFALYDKMHKGFEVLGGIDAVDWLNLYQCLWSLKSDVNDDGVHPGKQSNLDFSQLLGQAVANNIRSI